MIAYHLQDGVTLAVAVLGAGLGILNTWNTYSQKRVKLRVIPKISQNMPGGMVMHATTLKGFPALVLVDGCIEVVNLSTFPVTVCEIGFTVKGRSPKEWRLSIPKPAFIDGKDFPRRLEPRESFTGYFKLKELNGGGGVARAFAKTECGVIVFGTSPVMKEAISKLG